MVLFEWDPQEARSNYEKHGISLEAAQRVFLDPFDIELEDDRFDYAEDRYVIVGQAEFRLITVVYTWRGNIDPSDLGQRSRTI